MKKYIIFLDYFTQATLLKSEFPSFMDKKMYTNIDKNIRLSNIEDENVKNDPIGRVRKLMDLMNKKFK